MKTPDVFLEREKADVREDFDEYVDKEQWIIRLIAAGVRERKEAEQYWHQCRDASGRTYRKKFDKQTQCNVLVVPTCPRVGVVRANRRIDRRAAPTLKRSNAFVEESDFDDKASDHGRGDGLIFMCFYFLLCFYFMFLFICLFLVCD